MKNILFAAAFIVLSSLGTPGHAAPLCVQTLGVPPQCLYEDVTACQREAVRVGGTCALNPIAPPILTRNFNALYCVVESGLIASCIYSDRASCDLEAARRQGTCVANLPEPYSQDPFKIQRPYY